MSKKPSERELPIEPGCLAQIIRTPFNPENIGRIVRVVRLVSPGEMLDGIVLVSSPRNKNKPSWLVRSIGAPFVRRVYKNAFTAREELIRIDRDAMELSILEQNLRRLPEVDPGEVEALYAAPVTPERARTLATELRDADFF